MLCLDENTGIQGSQTKQLSQDDSASQDSGRQVGGKERRKKNPPHSAIPLTTQSPPLPKNQQEILTKIHTGWCRVGRVKVEKRET